MLRWKQRIGTEMWGLCFPSGSGNFSENSVSLSDWNCFVRVVLLQVRLSVAPPVSPETARFSLFWCSLSAPIMSSIWHTSVNWGTCLTSLLVYKDIRVYLSSGSQVSPIGFPLYSQYFFYNLHVHCHSCSQVVVCCVWVCTYVWFLHRFLMNYTATVVHSSELVRAATNDYILYWYI